MSRQIVDGVWVIKCDFTDETGNICELGVNGDPAMFVDPTGGKDPNEHFQCGSHHGVFKQEDSPDFKVPEGHKLDEKETTLVKDANYKSPSKVKLDGFKPDAGGRVWDGTNVKR